MDDFRGPYRVTGKRDVYRTPWMYLREEDVVLPSGRTSAFGILEMKPGASALALDEERCVWLVSEYKMAVGRETWEVVSGGIEPGEAPLETARRELREEAGLEAAEWIEMGKSDPFTTLIHSPNYMFLARGIRHVGAEPDDGEVMQVRRVPLERAVEMVLGGEITHAASCLLILKTERWLRMA